MAGNGVGRLNLRFVFPFARTGHGDSNAQYVPTIVHDISGVGSVSCGSAHTLALSRDGKTVWSFGNGDGGKLGHGDTVRVYKPRVIEALQGMIIKKVCAGHQFSLALTLSGRVSRNWFPLPLSFAS